MRCPNCNNKVLQKSGGKTRLRTQGQIVFDEDGTCHTQCYWCKSPVEVPLELGDVVVEDERFYLKKAIPPKTST